LELGRGQRGRAEHGRGRRGERWQRAQRGRLGLGERAIDRRARARPRRARRHRHGLARRRRVGRRVVGQRGLADNGLWVAAPKYEAARSEVGFPEDLDFPRFAHPYVRGAVLHAMRALRAQRDREVPLEGVTEARRARDRGCLDELGAGIDPDAYDAYEDTDAVYGKRARELAGEGMLVLVLARLREKRLAQIEAELLNLPPRHALLIRMRFQEGKTLDAIAQATEIPRTNVFRLLAEAVATLRRRLDEAERGP
jgi:RNA polymerase sigma factor (sigma-70 family)